MTTTVFSVPDIVCEGCGNAIRKALGRVAGVSEVAVDIAKKSVAVCHDSEASRETLIAALDRAGFPVAA